MSLLPLDPTDTVSALCDEVSTFLREADPVRVRAGETISSQLAGGRLTSRVEEGPEPS